MSSVNFVITADEYNNSLSRGNYCEVFEIEREY